MIEPRAALDAVGLLPDAEIDIADVALQFARIAMRLKRSQAFLINSRPGHQSI